MIGLNRNIAYKPHGGCRKKNIVDTGFTMQRLLRDVGTRNPELHVNFSVGEAQQTESGFGPRICSNGNTERLYRWIYGLEL